MSVRGGQAKLECLCCALHDCLLTCEEKRSCVAVYAVSSCYRVALVLSARLQQHQGAGRSQVSHRSPMHTVKALLCLPVLAAASTSLQDYLSEYLRLSGINASCEDTLQKLSAKSWDDAKSRCTEERLSYVTVVRHKFAADFLL